MSLSFRVEHREGYGVVRVEGQPSLGQFLSFLQVVGVETAGWPVRRALFDLAGVRTLTAFTDRYAVGQEAARQLQHLQRVASVVPADLMTHAGEKTAQRAGLNLMVFAEEGAAVRWLLER